MNFVSSVVKLALLSDMITELDGSFLGCVTYFDSIEAVKIFNSLYSYFEWSREL